MAVKVAIIGLGIMGQRMLTHMRLHQNFEPDYLWDPDESACHQAMILDPQSKIMNSASDAISKADLVYLACPPAVREPYALAAAERAKPCFWKNRLVSILTIAQSLWPDCKPIMFLLR